MSLGLLEETDYGKLAQLAQLAYFAPADHRRVAVVLTDGESRAVVAGPLARALAAAGVKLVFVRFWAPSERVYLRNGGTEAYRPDPASGRALAALAQAVGAQDVSGRDLGGALGVISHDLGPGPTRRIGTTKGVTPLAPWLLVAAALPLAFLLARRAAPRRRRPWLRLPPVRAHGAE